jgi:hypothetical protein
VKFGLKLPNSFKHDSVMNAGTPAYACWDYLSTTGTNAPSPLKQLVLLISDEELHAIRLRATGRLECRFQRVITGSHIGNGRIVRGEPQRYGGFTSKSNWGQCSGTSPRSTYFTPIGAIAHKDVNLFWPPIAPFLYGQA